jgi:hypothetical protein
MLIRIVRASMQLRNMARWLISGVLAALFFVGGFLSGKHFSNVEPTEIVKVDTFLVVDTLRIIQPIEKTKEVVRMDTVRLLAVDTLRISDTVTVVVPIESKEYSDSTYKAWVSGYKASLDSIEVYPKTQTIHNTTTTVKRTKWNISAQIGMGYCGNQIKPYVGVGFGYNLFSW